MKNVKKNYVSPEISVVEIDIICQVTSGTITGGEIEGPGGEEED